MSPGRHASLHGDRHDRATPEVAAASHIELQEATEEMSRGVAFFWKPEAQATKAFHFEFAFE